MNLVRCSRWIAMLVLAAGTALSTTGCVSALATALYVVKGNDVAADFPGLKNKKVAVICRAAGDLGFSSASATRDLARNVVRLLQARVPKVEVIPAADVENWADENSWEDPRDIGKALGASMVVDIDLEHFSLYKGQTLYQGTADYTVQVLDMDQGGEVVFKKSPPRVVWPPNSALLTSDKREPEFRQEFVAVLAEEVGRHFYAHDAYSNVAVDAELQ